VLSNPRVIKTFILIVVVLSLGLSILIAPRYLFQFLPNSHYIEYGIHYYYLDRTSFEINNDVKKIYELGIKYIRIELDYDPKTFYTAINNKTRLLYSLVSEYGLKTMPIVRYDDIGDKLKQYIENWHDDIVYYQILNEPDVMQTSWGLGEYMDDELDKMVSDIVNEIKTYDSDALTIVNLTLVILRRINLLQLFKNKVDFFGLDVYEDTGLIAFPSVYKMVKEITNKEIFVTEFGRLDNTSEEDRIRFFNEGISIFKGMGVDIVFFFDWATGWYKLDENILGKVTR